MYNDNDGSKSKDSKPVSKSNSKRAISSEDPNQKKLTRLVNFIVQQSQVSLQISQQLNTLFELLLWAERKSPELLLNTLDMGLLQQVMILQVQSDDGVLGFIKGVTLLFGNCVQGGIIITHLLQIGYGDQVFKNAIAALNMKNNCDPDQLVQYLGSYLKSYAKHLSQSTLQHYFSETKCLLAEVCCNFYNCTEQLTRTAVMNILLSILGIDFSKQFLLKSNNLQENVFLKWAFVFTVQFRNQLMAFDQVLKNSNKTVAHRKIQQINDTIILWQDITAVENTKILFRKFFLTEILHPLLAGSMSKQSRPVFSLKFSLIVLGKLLPVFDNLQLLQQLAQIIFLGVQFTIHNSKMSIVKFPSSFDILKVASRSMIQQNFNHIKDLISMDLNGYINIKEVNQFFFAVLKSRDDQFISLICTLIIQFLSLIRNQGQNRSKANFNVNKYSAYQFLSELFNINNAGHSNTYEILLQTLLNQLHAPHSLNTLIIISRTIAHFHIKCSKIYKMDKSKFKNHKTGYKIQAFDTTQQFKQSVKQSNDSKPIASKIWQSIKQDNQKAQKLSDSFERRWDQFAQLQKRELIDFDQIGYQLEDFNSKSNSKQQQKSAEKQCQNKDSFSPCSLMNGNKNQTQSKFGQKDIKTQRVQQYSMQKYQNINPILQSEKHIQMKQQVQFIEAIQIQQDNKQHFQQDFEQYEQKQQEKPKKAVSYLQHDQRNKMIFLFRSIINEIRKIIEQKQNINFISQTMEYDIKAVENINFFDNLYKDKMQELQSQVNIFCQNFPQQNLGDYCVEEELPFYQSIPDTPQDSTRYKLAKFFLFRKLRYFVIQSNDEILSQIHSHQQRMSSSSQGSSQFLDRYYRNVLKSQGSIYMPGQIFSIEKIKQPFHPCKLIQKEDPIDVALIDDENALIIGFIEKSKSSLKVLMNVKLKHVSSQVIKKGGKVFIDFLVKAYNVQKQRVQVKSKFMLRGFEMGLQYIPNKKMKFTDKQINFLLRLLKRCEKDIPEISLI